MSATTLTITRPDDWHLHVRDGEVLPHVVPHTARCFGRAIIMPNLVPPVTDVDMAMSYRQDILNACPGDCDFEALMTLYLTDHTSPADVKAAADNQYVHAFKLYPAGATTNSASGVTSLPELMPTLEAVGGF